MTTLPITVPSFDGGANLNQGSRSGFESLTLSEYLALVRSDIVSVEALIAAVNAKSSFPIVRAVRVTGGTLSADGSENFTVLGQDLLQSQVRASRTLGTSLVISAEEPGTPGNVYQVEVVDTGGAGPSTVAYAAGKLTIDLVGLTPNENTIAALINVAAAAWTGILMADSGGGGAVPVTTARNLIGGVGSGLKVFAGGGQCTPVGQSGGGVTSTPSFSNTSLAANPPALTGLTPALQATTDSAAIWVVSNGKMSNAVDVVLA